MNLNPPPFPYKPHPLAELFPLIEGAEFWALVEDIRINGVREPVVLLDQQVLDGRNRYLASREAGVECPSVEFTGPDPLQFVISHNLRRRHLNESQRALVAARIAKLPHGHRQTGQLADVPTQEQAAEMLKVGERSVRRAAEVIDRAEPALEAMVAAGHVSVSAAAEVSRLDPVEQHDLAEQGPAAIKRAASYGRQKRETERWQDRVDKLMTRARETGPLQLRKPDLRVSIAVHCHVRGGSPEVVDTVAHSLGISTSSFAVAVKMLTTPPEVFEREQREAGLIIGAIMATTIEADEIEVRTRITDTSEAEYLEKVWRRGWVSAVLCQPDDGGGPDATPETMDVWREGRTAFAAAYGEFLKADAEAVPA